MLSAPLYSWHHTSTIFPNSKAWRPMDIWVGLHVARRSHQKVDSWNEWSWNESNAADIYNHTYTMYQPTHTTPLYTQQSYAYPYSIHKCAKNDANNGWFGISIGLVFLKGLDWLISLFLAIYTDTPPAGTAGDRIGINSNLGLWDVSVYLAMKILINQSGKG